MSSQARIGQSALDKVAAVGPDQIVRFLVRLDDGLLPDDEVAALKRLGIIEFMPLFKQALVALPARRLLELAELKSIIHVI